MIAVLGMLAFSSCKVCVVCDGCSGDKICRSDYDTEQDYQDAVDLANALGCDCH